MPLLRRGLRVETLIVAASRVNILIVGPSWVGDMVLAQSLFKTLRLNHPDAALDVLAPGWSAALLDRMPEVRRSITLPVGHGELKLGARWAVARTLRDAHYDWAIVLPNSLKAALVPWFAQIPRRTGFRGEWRYGLLNEVRTLDKARLPRTVDRFVALALAPDAALPSSAPSPQLRVDDAGVQRARDRLGLPPSVRPILALCPGAEYGPAKRWPVEHFAEVAQHQTAAGWDVWLFGSDKDRDIANDIAQRAGAGCSNLAGRTALGEAIDLMSQAAAVVSNDSGLMHVAAALNRPLIAIYGSSDPNFTPPMNAQAQVVRLGLDCSPCFQRTCPLGHTRCLRDITPESVMARLAAIAR